MDAMVEASGQKLSEAYQISEKMKRQDAVAALKEEALAQFVSEEGPSRDEVSEIFGKNREENGSSGIIDGQPRIDGRDTKTVRDIRVEVGVLARTHGSALFTRGETQALVTTTLGSMRDAAIIDALQGSYRDPLLHYNFLPTVLGKLDLWAGRSAVRLVMAVWHGGVLLPFYQKLRTGRTPRGWYRK